MTQSPRIWLPLLLVWIIPSYVFACSVVERTDEEKFSAAKSVFLAHVTRTTEVAPNNEKFGFEFPMVEGDVTVIEVFKGHPPDDLKVNTFTFAAGNCTFPLLAGADYLFFIADDSTGLVNWPAGSQMFLNRDGSEVKPILAKLRALRR